MSTPHSSRTRKRIDFLIALAALLAVCGMAQAKQSDKDQPIHINATGHLIGSQQSGKIVVTDNVTLDQGTFHADGNKAVGHTDPNDTSQWQRIVITGTPAHFSQTQDNGTLIHGQAQTLDYEVSRNIVILTGDASVVQQGKGSFQGEKLTYNTDTGQIQGSAAPGGRVHITLQPRSKPAPASAPPASAVSTAPASTSTALAPPNPVPATSTPAPAATSGTH